MVDADSGERDRARIGWWLFVGVLAVAAAFLAYSFVGLLALGIFGYYATRPICRKLARVIDSDSLAAGATVLLVLLPIVLLVLYAGVQLIQQAQQLFGGGSDLLAFVGQYLNLGSLRGSRSQQLASILQNPEQLVTNPEEVTRRVLQAGAAAMSALAGTLVFVALAVTLSYFLLKNDDGIAEGLRRLFGGEDTTAYAYATAVDSDLESVFFGNFLFILLMSFVATVTYWATNVLAPQPLSVPSFLVLGFLTGIASLVPIVVGKIVYLPVVAYLAVQTVRADGGHLVFVGGVLVAYFLVLDILPQTFLQPYITGRHLDMIVLMFAYLLGPIVFGWYGFFLLPIVFVLMLETVRIVLPELVHGERLSPSVSMGESIGATPRITREGAPESDDAPTDDTVPEGE